jgi:hypothetical protein
VKVFASYVVFFVISWFALQSGGGSTEKVSEKAN